MELRGPFGRPWPVDEAAGGDLLIVAGGLGHGAAPLGDLPGHPPSGMFRRVMLLVGARGPEHSAVPAPSWNAGAARSRRAIEVHLTVDVPDDAWPYPKGVVTTLFPHAGLAPQRDDGVHLRAGDHDALRDARVSCDRASPTERAVGDDGAEHALRGEAVRSLPVRPVFVCTDGPIFRWEGARPMEWSGAWRSRGPRAQPRVAVFKMASCDGCQLQLLDAEEALLELAGASTIVQLRRGDLARRTPARTT